MRKVFIPHLPTRYDKATNQRVPSVDTNPATKFGELIVMTGSGEPRPVVIASAKERAAEIGADDYILAVGDVVVLAVVLARAISRNGRATLLRWSNTEKEYRTEEITE